MLWQRKRDIIPLQLGCMIVARNSWDTQTGTFCISHIRKSGLGITSTLFHLLAMNMLDGYASNLGKRVKIDTLPKHVQKWIRGYQKVWTDYINNPDEEWARKAWEKYN